jgi:hypothetical protein
LSEIAKEAAKNNELFKTINPKLIYLDHFMPVNVDYYDIKLNLYTNVTLKIGKIHIMDILQLLLCLTVRL